jgi:osmoprotectant transport system ATP-binding protein
VIDFIDVIARRGSHTVLRGVSLGVAAGEIIALVGRSGSGKTTMLRLVNRLLAVESGCVRVGGRDVNEWDPIALRRQTGYAIQDVGLFPHLSVADNIAIVPRLLQWDRGRIVRRTTDLLERIGLTAAAYASRYPDELSGGQRQRVGLARALAADPAVLLMDEPFGALDPMTRVELHRQFRALHDAMPRTVLMVTHDLSEAFAIAHRVAVLHEGHVVACATPEQLQQSTDPAVRALLETRFG